MCLILFALDTHPGYPLVLAANRDEFYDRPTAPCASWQDTAGTLAGRDLRGGGTWLGVNRRGRLAAITNYREPIPGDANPNSPSRGHLVSTFLSEKAPKAEPYLREISPRAHRYNGFNLLLRDVGGKVLWFTNRKAGIHPISPGVHGLCNHLMDTPWPKVRRGRDMLASILSAPGKPDIEAIFTLLSDNREPDPEELPDTGIGKEWERLLSPIFVRSPVYGTRSSTIVTVDARGRIRLLERTYLFSQGKPAGEETMVFDGVP